MQPNIHLYYITPFLSQLEFFDIILFLKNW